MVRGYFSGRTREICLCPIPIPVGATVKKPIPILSCADSGIVFQSYGDFGSEDLGINRNLSHMLGQPSSHMWDGFPPDT